MNLRTPSRPALVALSLVAVVLLLLAGRGVLRIIDNATGPDGEAPNDVRADATTPSAAPGDCPPDDGVAVRATKFAGAPPMCIDVNKHYAAEITTNVGKLTFALDAEAAPTTVNNFVFLVRNRFYEGIKFHRIIGDFVAQAGDAGEPGYTIPDELPAAGAYRLGSLAMANAGPNTGSTQFFIVTGQAGIQLPPKYPLFGTLVQGFDILDVINKLGTPSGTPTGDVIIRSASITVD
jgi:cyclophilin family peptidyl-prolyl cis-trans isomerase